MRRFGPGGCLTDEASSGPPGLLKYGPKLWLEIPIQAGVKTWSEEVTKRLKARMEF